MVAQMERGVPNLPPAMRPGWHTLTPKPPKPQKPQGHDWVWFCHGLFLGVHLVIAYLLYPVALYGLCTILFGNVFGILFLTLPTIAGFLILWTVSSLFLLALSLDYRAHFASRTLRAFRLLLILIHLFEMGWFIRTWALAMIGEQHFSEPIWHTCFPDNH
jgi:hypothetical protein